MYKVALALLFVVSCNGIGITEFFPKMEEQDKAMQIVSDTFAFAGLERPPPTAILWFRDECLPEPWALGDTKCDPEVHECRCLNGRAIYLIWGCVAAVRWRDTVISDTSFAHEVGWHCGNFDPFHDLDLDPVVYEANERLRSAGL